VTANILKSVTHDVFVEDKHNVSDEKYPVAEPVPYLIVVALVDNYSKFSDKEVLY
jgi:hypothetical protein